MIGGLKRSTALNNRERKQRKGRKTASGGRFTGGPSRQQKDKAVCLLTLPAYHAPIHSQQPPGHMRVMDNFLLLQLSFMYLVWLERHFNVWCYFLKSTGSNHESVRNINILKLETYCIRVCQCTKEILSCWVRVNVWLTTTTVFSLWYLLDHVTDYIWLYQINIDASVCCIFLCSCLSWS